MEQKSNVQYRAEKEYKNSKGGFALLLREVISNAIHAVLIRQSKEQDDYLPDIKLSVEYAEEEGKCKISLRDNGEGFTEKNSKYFNALDVRNDEKEGMKFHPLGQGRLAIVYFSNYAEYETVYRDKDGNLKKRTIPYPQDTNTSIFDIEHIEQNDSQEQDSYTKLTLSINNDQAFGRAKTFFNKHLDAASLKEWFVATFFPFIIANEKLKISIEFNENCEVIDKNDIEAGNEIVPFEIPFSEEEPGKSFHFKLWLIKKDSQKLRGENPIVCFARNLQANLSNGKLSYSLDSNDGYVFYLTSDYFDEHVDTKGEKIEIPEDVVSQINSKINEILDNEFKTTISENKKVTKRNLKTFKEHYPSLEPFVEETNILEAKNIVKEDEIVKTAVDEKSKIEQKFWNRKNDEFSDSTECQKLLNSSLHIYVEHRRRVLDQLHHLIQKFDKNGNDKPELESTVHELFLKRGTTLKDSNDINHLHNLWILDDKFTIFSNDLKAESTKSGQACSDIYIWADDPGKAKQILILELKSTTKAHNAGGKNKNKEGMIAQVRRYAKDFYKEPTKFLNWDVDTSSILYTSIIIARKNDIKEELTSNNVSGFKRIPFLSNSFYADDAFNKPDVPDPMDTVPMRIELYSFEDIYELASSRNEVFFKLLQKEFEVVEDTQLIENEESAEPMQ